MLTPPCTLQVVEILDETSLKGRVVNSKTLGERKNCNLPGVMVQLPVLGEGDLRDVRVSEAMQGWHQACLLFPF
jgi:pyruvate kinase